MSSINLTKSEAAARTRLLEVDHYRIQLDLTGADTGSETFASRTTITVTAKESGSTVLDFRGRSVHQVTVDNTDVTDTAVPTTEAGAYDEAQGLSLELTAGEHTVVVEATAEYSHSGQGLHYFVDKADGKVYTYTQFEPADAKRVFACFDQPDLKATFAMEVITPAGWTVVTNAPVETRPAPADTADSSGALLHTARTDYRMSTYLVALIAGEYVAVTDEWSGRITEHPETAAYLAENGSRFGENLPEMTIPLGIYCRQSIAHALDADTIFEQTKQGFDFYAKKFGIPYPFGKYDQVFCPEYNMGAMENAGCVTLRDEYIFTSTPTEYRIERRCDTILHEMAHMWFGDLVTMSWWDDLWLNESFATWSSATAMTAATKYSTAWTTYTVVEKAWAYAQDSLPTTHPISTDASDIETVEQNFDGITYAKGMSVLKQLAAYVGEDAFFAGVRLHFARHAFANATFDDLLASLSEASGRDLSDWADQWLKTTGMNTLSVEATTRTNRDGVQVYDQVTVIQATPEENSNPLRTHRIAVGLYDASGQRTHRAEVDVTGERTPVRELEGQPVAALVLPNDDDLTYAQVNLDAQSLDWVKEHLSEVSDGNARGLLWSITWQMTRNGQMKARDFFELVARHAEKEPLTGVLSQVLSQAATAVSKYADPSWVSTLGQSTLAAMLLDGVKHTAGFHQIAFLNQLFKVVPSEMACTLFRNILAGTPEKSGVQGLKVDQEMRWNALTSLIAHGAVPTSQADQLIAEELERDPLSSGQNFAWRAHAAIPTSEVKQEIFAQLTDTQTVRSNLERRHKLEGFTFPGAEPRLQQFTDRVIELAPTLWKEFSSETALQIVEGLFPTWSPTKDTVAAVENLINAGEAAGVTAGLKRVLLEGNDTLVRIIRNRSVDRREG